MTSMITMTKGAILCTALLALLVIAPAAFAQRGSAVRSAPGEFLVTRFGAKCNGTADDTEAFQAALNAAGAKCVNHGAYIVAGFATVLVPNGAVCKLNSGLIDARSDCVGIASYGGATLDFSGLPRGDTAITLKSQVHGAYSGNVPRFSNIQMIGPGRASGTVGIASATPNLTFHQYNISGFGHCYQVESGSWLNHFVNTAMSNCHVALYCGVGLNDAGEQISFEGGSVFNSDQGVVNDSCEFNITDSSLDEFSGPAVLNGGGVTRLTSDHIEYVNSTTAEPLVVSSRACNAWGGIIMQGGQIQFDHAGPKALARNDGGSKPCGGGGMGSYIRLNNVFFGNIPMNSKGEPVVTGSNASQIAVCRATSGAGGGAIGNVRNIGPSNVPNQGPC